MSVVIFILVVFLLLALEEELATLCEVALGAIKAMNPGISCSRTVCRPCQLELGRWPLTEFTKGQRRSGHDLHRLKPSFSNDFDPWE